MSIHELYMSRCLQLARLAQGHAAPNPQVGALLVHGGRIIGEGWHRSCGGPHAEVECLESVALPDRSLIPSSTLYVSLEPCAHQGRTPPCADRIIAEGIRQVVIGCRDPFSLVDGRGIERMEAAGVQVTCGVLSSAAEDLIRRFRCFHLQKRPYVILKWAQTADGRVAATEGLPCRISSKATDRLVHLWRSQESAIFVGSGTALTDNPKLTCRIPGGRHPLRVVVDRACALPSHLHLFDGEAPTLVCNVKKEGVEGMVSYARIMDEPDLLPGLLHTLYQRQVQSLLVEGGVRWMESFLQAGCWDEVRLITAIHTRLPDGLPGPQFRMQGNPQRSLLSGQDRIDIFMQSESHG